MGAHHLWHVDRKRRLHAGVHRTDAARVDPVGPVRILRRPLPPVLAGRLFPPGAFRIHRGIRAIMRIALPYRLSGTLYLPLPPPEAPRD